MTKNHDVLGIGNAIVDVLAQVPEEFIARHNMRKASMTLIAQEEAETIYQSLATPKTIAGGAVANSMVGISMLGGRAAYIGKTAADPLGDIFAGDMKKIGVHFKTKPLSSGQSTARSMIVVTPDGQRTMNTYLGAALFLEQSDIDAAVIQNSKIVFIEGYLWDTPHLRPHLELAAKLCAAHGTKLAFTLSDAWLIDRHRDDMRKFVRDYVDILFSNELEITSFYQTADLDEAMIHLRKDCEIGIITQSENGSKIVHRDGVIDIAAVETKVVDTTGAGDLYAGGFLFGVSQGMPLERCGKIASICAAEAISHLGARPIADLKALVGV